MINRHLVATAALVVRVAAMLAAAMPLHAQIANPGGATPTQNPTQPGVPPPQQVNNTDRLFVLLVGAGGLGEVELARLAESKAAAPGVKQFAQRMVQDHGRGNAYLVELAGRAGVTVPNEPGPDEKATQQQLRTLQGPSFDLAYLRSQLVDHQKTVQLLEWEAGQGQNADLQRYAMTMLPDVMAHLASVQALLADATGALPSGLAQAPALHAR